MTVEVSFVVPAFDEERMIGRTLAALAEAAAALGTGSEVIVVDDASGDATASIAEAAGARVVRVAHRQIAATRNSGASEARGDLLVFVDADTLVGPEVVAAAVAAMRGGAVGGGAAVRFDGPQPLWTRLVLPLLIRLYRAAGLASGCFVFATRAAFEAVGGFDERYFGGEEVWLSRALRRRGRFVLLRESVVSSGRKFRGYTGWEILGLMARVVLGGRRALRRRRGMDLWYGERRRDPWPPERP